MSQIGIFTANDNGYTGTLRTLTMNAKVTLVPVESDNDKAPNYRVMAGTVELGAAWKKVSANERPYLSVAIDDPCFPATVYARLIEGEDGKHYLHWTRPKAN